MWGSSSVQPTGNKRPQHYEHNDRGVFYTNYELSANYHLLWILLTEITSLYTPFLPPLLYNIPEIHTKQSFATTLISPYWFMFRFIHTNHDSDCAYNKIANQLTLNEINIAFITTLP